MANRFRWTPAPLWCCAVFLDAPIATYRVQLTASFGFDAAAAVAASLAELGVSHLYASPYLRAAAGSSHGYDVVDHASINPELGGQEAHARMCGALREQGLSQLVDIVPNHMGITGRDNAWWWDVLKHGPSSRYAGYFDIDWEAPEARLHGKVLLPILGDQFGRAIEAGHIRLEHSDDQIAVRYFDHVMPLSPGSVREVEADLERVNRDPDLLEHILRQQPYRLAWWRTAAHELNYRRFFDINGLIGLRLEEPEVFESTHRAILAWVAEGCVTGLRVDHPDGLRDPVAYFHRLRAAAPDAWVVVEKILSGDEPLPENWPVDGTTGYEFLNRVNGLFIDPAGEPALTDLYHKFTGECRSYEQVLREKKELVLRKSFGGELNRLTHIAIEICESRRNFRDFTRRDLHEAIGATITCFPVYRTYIRPDCHEVTATDRRLVEQATTEARLLRPELDRGLFELIHDLLLMRLPGRRESEFVLRFQQLTGPAMAKGAEDTAFYCYNRFVSLNEVGGDPGRFGVDVDSFHEACAQTQRRWPRTLLATSTHDTKRGEDVRARLNILSEVPDRWAAAVRRWATINQRHRTSELPDRNAEYLLYQTLVGAWPIDTQRASAYMIKAAREAKTHTSWTDPDATYEHGLTHFVERVIQDDDFLRDLASFLREIIAPGRTNSLAQTLLKLTAPGVPDIYQGSELWDLNLVDPDNRRPVDFALRRHMLSELSGISPQAAMSRIDSGLPKLLLIQRALRVRRDRPEAFGPAGEYQPLKATGAKAAHIVAFMRGGQVITIVPRLVTRLANGWHDTRLQLPPGRWRDAMAGESFRGAVDVGELFRDFPVSLLCRQGE